MITLYVIEGLANGRRYVGITHNLERRLSEHESGASHSGCLIGSFRLLHTESFQTYALARERENFSNPGADASG